MNWFNRQPTRRALALWLLPLGFVVAFFFYPLLKILTLAGEGGAGGVTWLAVWRPLRFTLFQAGLSTLLTLLVACLPPLSSAALISPANACSPPSLPCRSSCRW